MKKKPLLDHLIFNPTKEQKSALMGMEAFLQPDSLSDFLILTGSAGTGKTSIISAVVNYLAEEGVDYHIAAPTGRAARIIGRKTRSTSKTIHGLIYIPNEDRETGRVDFQLKTDQNEHPAVYIIDEASMVSKNPVEKNGLFGEQRGLLADLIGYIKNGNVHNKLIFIGDRYQLPPIEEEQSYALNKAFLSRHFNLSGTEYHLSEVKRQKDGSYILDSANEIKGAIDEGFQKVPLRAGRSRSIFAAADQFVKDQKSYGEEHLVTISVSNKANKFFNDLVRQRKFDTRDLKILEKGDLMLVTRNWSRADVALSNGDHVKVLDVDLGKIDEVAGLHFAPVRLKLLFSEQDVELEDLMLLECLLHPSGYVETEKFKALRQERYIKNKVFRQSNDSRDDRYAGAIQMIYGNAITCHKAQGGEWEKVFINELGIPNLKWQYTAITRARNELKSFGK